MPVSSSEKSDNKRTEALFGTFRRRQLEGLRITKGRICFSNRMQQIPNISKILKEGRFCYMP